MQPAAIAAPFGEPPTGRFRLMRYFTMTTLIVFVAAGTALYFLQRGEEVFFDKVQTEQRAFFAQAQAELARQHETAARAGLLSVHEASHVTLTRIVANLLWSTDFAPFVAKTQQFSVDHCRALAAPAGASDSTAVNARRACFADVGGKIRSLPDFKALDAKAYSAMRATSVFKIKVFDLRGITVYSSEHGQIGEDAVQNLGWRAAVAGKPASELTHRDRFSAFERVVENRDLISTYVPVHAADSNEIVGVFEIYSDVTPFLGQIKVATDKFAAIASGNEAAVAQKAASNQREVNESSNRFLLIVGGLLALLYLASWVIVRIGQRIIDKQTLAQEQAAQREQLWHHEKMAALATMADNVSHEVGNPLAIISGVVEDLATREEASASVAASQGILEQVERIKRMMGQISNFATARSRTPERVDVNSMVKAVCDFQSFDRRFHATPIEFRPGNPLPACEVVPDHLNEVLMNVLQTCMQASGDSRDHRPITVETAARDDRVLIRIRYQKLSGASSALLARMTSDARFQAARRRVAEMGATLSTTQGVIEIALPPSCAKKRAAAVAE